MGVHITSFLAASRAVRLLEASGFKAPLSSGFLAPLSVCMIMKIHPVYTGEFQTSEMQAPHLSERFA